MRNQTLYSPHVSLRAKVTVPQRFARGLTMVDIRPLVHGPHGLLKKVRAAY